LCFLFFILNPLHDSLKFAEHAVDAVSAWERRRPESVALRAGRGTSPSTRSASGLLSQAALCQIQQSLRI
jgi:hypothetical protein